jgi:hypothetical protein
MPLLENAVSALWLHGPETHLELGVDVCPRRLADDPLQEQGIPFVMLRPQADQSTTSTRSPGWAATRSSSGG